MCTKDRCSPEGLLQGSSLPGEQAHPTPTCDEQADDIVNELFISQAAAILESRSHQFRKYTISLVVDVGVGVKAFS